MRRSNLIIIILLLIQSLFVFCSEDIGIKDFKYQCSSDKDCRNGYVCDKERGCIRINKDGGIDICVDVYSDISDIFDIEDGYYIVDIGYLEDSEVKEDVILTDIEDAIDVRDVIIEDTGDIVDVGSDTYDANMEDVITDTSDVVNIEDSGIDVGVDAGCNMNCGDNASCINGFCVCNTGYGNCDNQWANGCEVNLSTEPEHCGDCLKGCIQGQSCIDGSCQGCVFEPYGQDYNLTRRCVRAVCSQDSPFYFEDTIECGSNSSSWLVAVESEASLGASCPGPANCSFLINGQDSPVTIEWYKHNGDCGENYTVYMKVDHITYPSPCEGDYWTWFAFMDHLQTGGGPYPPVLQTITHHTLSFSSFTPEANSSARVYIGGQWWWGDKARAIEFNVVLKQWGDADPHPGLVVRFDTPQLEFLALDATYWGMNIIEGKDVVIEVPWGRILQDAVNNGWLATPSSWQDVSTMSYFIGMETKNRAVGSLWHTDFRISHKP